MLPESVSLKLLAATGGILAGLTVLVRLGRLLEALETVQKEVVGLREEMKAVREDVAEMKGKLE